MFMSQPLVPQNVTLHGNRVIADITRMRFYWSRVDPSSNMTDVLLNRREDTQKTHKGKKHGMMGTD